MSDPINTTHSAILNQEYPWHQDTWKKFSNAKATNKLPHAVLISGEEGIAKVSLAKRMAKSLLCIKSASTEQDACNECSSCKTYESGANPDFTQITLLEDKQQIGVDQIRTLSEFLNYSRSYNTYRVVILYPVERMNINAANSLLKSLEEPSAHTVIILVTAKMNQLLATIKSRCQLFYVKPPNKEETFQWLQHYQSKQNKETDTPIDSDTLIKMVGNKPLKAINVTQEDIDSRNKFFKDLIGVIQEQISITEMAKNWEKYNPEVLLNWQILIIQNTIKTIVINSDDPDKAPAINNQLTQHLSSEEHWFLYQNLIKQKQFIHTSVNSLMFIQNMIMLWLKDT